MQPTSVTIHRNGQNEGPFTIEQINQMAHATPALLKDLAWHEGLTEWVPLSSIAGVYSHTPPPPPQAHSSPSLAQAFKYPTEPSTAKFKISHAIWIILLLCFVGGGTFIYYTKTVEQQRIADLDKFQREQKKTAELEKKIADLAQQSADASAAAKQQSADASAAAAADSEKRKAVQWNALIDQVIIKLERVRDEQDNFKSATTLSQLGAEETRMKTISREQESAARSVIVELKATGFQNADKLDKLVQKFVSDYGFYVSWKRLFWASFMSIGTASDEGKKQMDEARTLCYGDLQPIRNLKQQ